MDRTPKPMEQYVHFRGGRYQVLNLAQMEDTGEMLVIYQALFGEGTIYACPLSGFASEVDRRRYPDAAQRWRFQRVVPPQEDLPEEGRRRAAAADTEPERGSVRESGAASSPAAAKTGVRGPADHPEDDDTVSSPVRAAGPVAQEEDPEYTGEEISLAPAVLQFLDAQTADEKLGVLARARGTLTDEMIDTMAFSLGIEVEPGPLDARYLDLRECLLTISRYEMDRGRFRSTLL